MCGFVARTVRQFGHAGSLAHVGVGEVGLDAEVARFVEVYHALCGHEFGRVAVDIVGAINLSDVVADIHA